MKTRILLMVLMFFLIGALSIQAADLTIKWANVVAPDHPHHIASELFAKLVSEKSNGRIQVDTFPAAQLGNEKDIMEGIMLGTIEFATNSPGSLSLFEPEFGILDCPYIFRDEEHLTKVARGEIGKELSSILESNRGVKILAMDWLYGTRHLTTKNTPVYKPEDTKGLLIRAPAMAIYLATVNAWGATATPVDFSDLYMALKQGVVDGQENPIPTIYTYKYYEAQKYLILTQHMIRINTVITNASWFDSLDDETKLILTESLLEATEHNNDLMRKQEKELIEELEKLGMEVIKPDVDAFREVCSNIHLDFEEEWGEGLFEKIQAIQ